MKVHQILSEAPIGDYKVFGDFDRNSSFRHETDRKLVTDPKLIEKTRQKFQKSPAMFNFYFVNSPAGNRHTEVGLVDSAWVRRELGDEVADTVDATDPSDINIIFTNNKGSQRIPMTPWIMAHRIGHVFSRYSYSSGGLRAQNPKFMDAHRTLIEHTGMILESFYGVRNAPKNLREIESNRQFQLLYRAFWHAIGTFRSARTGKLRDWFEMNNELFAQYLTTGRIKFNQFPMTFGRGVTSRTFQGSDYDRELLQQALEDMADNLMSGYYDACAWGKGRTWVM